MYLIRAYTETCAEIALTLKLTFSYRCCSGLKMKQAGSLNVRMSHYPLDVYTLQFVEPWFFAHSLQVCILHEPVLSQLVSGLEVNPFL